MDPAESVMLPGGFLDDDGSCHREVLLHPLRGTDEDRIVSLARPVAQPFVVTELLSSCAERLGPRAATPDNVRRLTVGDRDFLMLQLRKITLGKKVHTTLICPNPDCGKRMDIAFSLDEIPVETQPLRPFYRFESWEFRLPQGGDQEALANLRGVGDGSRTMVNRLLSRCLFNAGEDDVESLPESDVAALESAMERAAPRVEFQMAAACPECAHEFTSSFDPASFFLDEILRSRSDFDREIHLLSFHYHWPLGDILAMTRGRRHRYLRCLLGQVDTFSEARA